MQYPRRSERNLVRFLNVYARLKPYPIFTPVRPAELASLALDIELQLQSH